MSYERNLLCSKVISNLCNVFIKGLVIINQLIANLNLVKENKKESERHLGQPNIHHFLLCCWNEKLTAIVLSENHYSVCILNAITPHATHRGLKRWTFKSEGLRRSVKMRNGTHPHLGSDMGHFAFQLHHNSASPKRTQGRSSVWVGSGRIGWRWLAMAQPTMCNSKAAIWNLYVYLDHEKNNNEILSHGFSFTSFLQCFPPYCVNVWGISRPEQSTVVMNELQTLAYSVWPISTRADALGCTILHKITYCNIKKTK